MLFVECISGFTQNEENWNGIQELREKILAETDDYSALAVRVRYHRWCDDWFQIARSYQYLKLRYPDPEPFVIIVVAYSYGVGHGLVQFAKQLRRYNLFIREAVICDGIYCHWHPLGWWRAIVGKTITLPDNITAYQGFYQKQSTPSGLQPRGSNCLSWQELHVDHVWMDDTPEFHNKAIQVIKNAAGMAVPSKKLIPIGAPATEATDSRLSLA